MKNNNKSLFSVIVIGVIAILIVSSVDNSKVTTITIALATIIIYLIGLNTNQIK